MWTPKNTALAGISLVLIVWVIYDLAGNGDEELDHGPELIKELDHRPGLVSAADFGDAWPLTVHEGIVRCSRDGLSWTFVYGETEYALNGIARGRGYPDIRPI